MTSVLKKVLPPNYPQSCPTSSSNTSPSYNNYNNNTTKVRILACSVVHEKDFFEHVDRQLCEDRRHLLEHLKPSNFSKSIIRLTATQATLSISTYMNDQLKYDFELDERVDRGEITRDEADLESEEWEQREWTRRWSLFPEKLLWAISKFQSIVMVMRVYEYIASHMCSLETLDKLTQDTFKGAQRLVREEGGQANLSREQKALVGKKMFFVSRNASIIAYLADFSVHQVLLMYGYYTFYQHRKTTKRREQRIQKQQDKEEEEKKTLGGEETKNNDDSKKQQDEEKEEEIMFDGTLAFSFVKRSTMLAVSRGIGLVSASAGGALGTIIWPGWGTLAGTNLGDSLSGVCLDELNIGSVTAPTSKP